VLQRKKKPQAKNLVALRGYFIFGGSVEYCECFNQAGVDAAGL